MAITITIQSVLTHAFELLIFAPLPILLLSAPFAYMKDWFVHQTNIRYIRKHYSNLELVGVEQLKQIFPNKKHEELEDIAYKLSERNASYKY